LTTVDLKTAVYNLINAVAKAIESGHVEKDEAFPYAVYALRNSIEGGTDNFGSIIYPLEIDVMDHDMGKDTTAIENLADTIDTALNRVHYVGSNFYFHCIRESRDPNYPTPDEYTLRRNLRYQVKVFTKG